jgi:hypothetical protein
MTEKENIIDEIITELVDTRREILAREIRTMQQSIGDKSRDIIQEDFDRLGQLYYKELSLKKKLYNI